MTEVESTWRGSIPRPTSVFSMREFRDWLASLPVKQSDTEGPAPDIHEYHDSMLYESVGPGAECASAAVIQAMAAQIYGCLVNYREPCEIVWRIRPEFGMQNVSDEFDAEGDRRSRAEFEEVFRHLARAKTYWRCAFRPITAARDSAA